MIDGFTRGFLVRKADRGITRADVIATLSEMFAMKRVPKHIHGDSRPEFLANEFRAWLERVGVSMRPSSRQHRENGFTESLHSRFRDERQVLELFDSIRDSEATLAA